MLLKKGAEANLYIEKWNGRKVIRKHRLAKTYRHAQLDQTIRTQRTQHEPTLIHRAKQAGVPTPTIYMIDPANSNIIMEYIQGKQLKQTLNHIPQKEKIRISHQIGTLIGQLHKHNIIHGDLTTSNIILTPNNKTYFVDFGLGEYSNETEIRGVDLHLMKQALQSTHHKHAKECFKAIIAGYTEATGKEETHKVLEKIAEIERRGRYIEER